MSALLITSIASLTNDHLCGQCSVKTLGKRFVFTRLTLTLKACNFLLQNLPGKGGQPVGRPLVLLKRHFSSFFFFL